MDFFQEFEQLQIWKINSLKVEINDVFRMGSK